MQAAGELGADGGPVTGAASSDLTFELCVNGQDPRLSRRRTRLRRYLGSSLTLTESWCKSERSEEREERSKNLDATRDLAKIDTLLRDGHSLLGCDRAPQLCSWSTAGATEVSLAWKGSELVGVQVDHAALMPCVPD